MWIALTAVRYRGTWGYIFIYICAYIFDSAHVEPEFDRGKVLGSTGIVLRAPIVD